MSDYDWYMMTNTADGVIIDMYVYLRKTDDFYIMTVSHNELKIIGGERLSPKEEDDVKKGHFDEMFISIEHFLSSIESKELIGNRIARIKRRVVQEVFEPILMEVD